jgi:opacity protein-like surface antigen
MFDAGWRTMSNSPDTEKAIFGPSSGIGAGVGVTYDRGSRWRFGVDVRRINRDGERAFAVDRTSEAFRLGHPLTLNLTESLASVTFRFGKLGPVSPYLGVGGGLVSWKESSDIAGLVEKADGTDGLFEARAGIERQQGPIRLAIEGGITLAPNTIGLGGISKVYEETDLGGLFLVFKLGFSGK